MALAFHYGLLGQRAHLQYHIIGTFSVDVDGLVLRHVYFSQADPPEVMRRHVVVTVTGPASPLF